MIPVLISVVGGLLLAVGLIIIGCPRICNGDKILCALAVEILS
jgi:hypothetical protein